MARGFVRGCMRDLCYQIEAPRRRLALISGRTKIWTKRKGRETSFRALLELKDMRKGPETKTRSINRVIITEAGLVKGRQHHASYSMTI